MSWGVDLLRSPVRALALTAIAVGAAGCSADSTRIFDGLTTARNAPSEVTGTVAPGQAAPVGRVDSSRLPAPGGGASEPPAQTAETGVAGGSRGLATYRPAPAANADVTGTVQTPAARRPAPPPQQWTWEGGTAVTVAAGENIETIA